MKQFLSSIAIFCLTITVSAAATLSGRVTSAITCAPVAGQMIYICDSTHPLYNLNFDSTLTNANGDYSFTIPASVPTSGAYLEVSTISCGNRVTTAPYYTGSSIAKIDFVNCGPKRSLGVVPLFPTAGAPGDVMIYLIRKSYDVTIQDTVLSAIDSSVSTSFNPVAIFYNACIPSGKLLVKAVPMTANPLFSSHMPTYFDSALRWNGASELKASNWNSVIAYVHMRKGVNPGGSGFIGGSVLLGANKSTSVGDPIGNKLVMLTTSTDTPVAAVYSDALGHFTFSNLAYGTYKIFGDAWGKTNPEMIVTISPSQPRVENILFEENNKTFKGSFLNLGAQPISALQGVKIFPNPASDCIYVRGLAAIKGRKILEIKNLTGSIIATPQEMNGSDVTSIQIATMPPGVYMLEVITEEGKLTFRIVK